jgi:5-methylcytosine-specific restriction endonuclease McrA
MQGMPAPKKRDYSGRVYKPRTCTDCPIVFTPGSSGQKRCTDCQYQHNLRLAREKQKQYNDAKREPRYCAICFAELPVYQGNHSRHCDTCRPLYRKEVTRESNERARLDGRHKQGQQRYKLANPDQVRESARRWRQAHPEEGLAAIHRRRVRVEAGRMDDLDRLLSTLYRKVIKGDPCFYCGTFDTQCVDHYFAIAKGGSDRFFNLVRACRKCNLSKRTMCGTAFLLLTGG